MWRSKKKVENLEDIVLKNNRRERKWERRERKSERKSEKEGNETSKLEKKFIPLIFNLFIIKEQKKFEKYLIKN